MKSRKFLQNSVYSSSCEQIEMSITEMTRGLIRSITYHSEVPPTAHTPRNLATDSGGIVKDQLGDASRGTLR